MQRRKEQEADVQEIQPHSHEISTDYNLRVQDRPPPIEGRQQCDVTRLSHSVTDSVILGT